MSKQLVNIGKEELIRQYYSKKQTVVAVYFLLLNKLFIFVEY